MIWRYRSMRRRQGAADPAVPLRPAPRRMLPPPAEGDAAAYRRLRACSVRSGWSCTTATAITSRRPGISRTTNWLSPIVVFNDARRPALLGAAGEQEDFGPYD